MSWTEATIGHTLARNTFKGGLVIVPNTSWTGHEADLLVVTERLMLVDVEAKISRADLKADAAKSKWREYQSWRDVQAGVQAKRLTWPPKVWKHYYALPRAIWKPELLDCLGSSASGVILLGGPHHPELFAAEVIRRAKPNPDAKPLTAEQVADVARLASLRMWDALRAIRAREPQAEAA